MSKRTYGGKGGHHHHRVKGDKKMYGCLPLDQARTWLLGLGGHPLEASRQCMGAPSQVLRTTQNTALSCFTILASLGESVLATYCTAADSLMPPPHHALQ